MRALLLAGGLFLVAGCFSHPTFIPVHDDEFTFDDYDGTVSYDAPGDAQLADAPVEVHEFDQAAATAAGAEKVIDGASWFGAGDYARNDMLNEVERDAPEGTTFVICVATGEVWKIPPDKFDAVSKIMDPWYGDEYDELDEYVGQNYAGPPLTYDGFLKVAAIDPQPVLAVNYLHDFGAVGRKEMLGVGGLQVMPRRLWLMSTPRQRSVRLNSIGAYLEKLPAFQGDKAPSFGVTVPWGMVYAAPKVKLDAMLGGSSLKGWTDYEIRSLPKVGYGTDRPIRNDDIVLKLDFKF